MQLIRRFRIPALCCALAVLVCELIARPYANMGIGDDGPYVLMARHLANTGHIVFNGWASPMLGWQLYLGAAFIKIFGFSFTAPRLSTLLIAIAMAFVLQRTLVRAGITERNATIGTLALVLSPLYLMLSVTFLTDTFGLFAVVICLYGCLRALQAFSSGAAIGWLCFAVAGNAICGTSRQIAWLGLLVMVPSTLWLLRTQRRVLVAGTAATFTGALFILACMQWLNRQPYAKPEHLLPTAFPVGRTFLELFRTSFEFPFLLLPIIVLFLPEVRKAGRRLAIAIAVFSAAYLLLVIRWGPSHQHFLEPTLGDMVSVHGIPEGMFLQGNPPIFIHFWLQLLITIASIGGLIGLIVSWACARPASPVSDSSHGISWKELGVLLGPFAIANALLLIPRATGWLYERYTLALLVVALLCIVRYYEERIQRRLPIGSFILIGIMAVYGIVITHNRFALYRARLAMAAEIRAVGISDTSVDNGWEYNFEVEIGHAGYINDSKIVIPAHAYVPAPPLPAGTCPMFDHDNTPLIRPLYGVSFDPNACYGEAPFAPVHYSRWPFSAPGTLYVVRYTPPAKS
ncbi:MAG: glycosyltransferase family 39 protein [Acidobacteriaceae bacterium]